jgi:hypothetical protein
MHITKLAILLSATHFLLIIILFLCFELELEGKQSIGHIFLWTLMRPATYFEGSSLIVLPLNSVLWGFCCALLFKGVRRIITK